MGAMRRPLHILAVLAAFAAPAAWAGENAIIVKADKGARVGREAAWNPATAGLEIGTVDLLEVPVGATVTVKLPDGKTLEIVGRAVVSGRRLVTDKSAAGRLVYFNKAFQDANATIVVNVEETGTTALAGRGAIVGDEENTRLGKTKRQVMFLSDAVDDDPPKSNAADFAESYLRKGEWQLAADAAWRAIASGESTPLERRRGHLVMARLATNEGQQEIALRDLDAACRSSGVESGGKPYIAAALVARGQAWMAIGDDAKALEDFRAALDFDAQGAAGAQANFFLGALALSQQDLDSAKSLFGRLNGFPELAQAGKDLLAAVAP